MKFYTNVQLLGNTFYSRGYENNKKFIKKENYNPTLFVSSIKKTQYKTIDGKYVSSIQPGSVVNCRKFIKKYENVEDFSIHGMDRYVYQYISDMYPEDEIEFDINKIKVYTIDIETTAEYGFPNISTANEEILLISIKDLYTKKVITWGRNPFDNTDPNVTYKEINSEYNLLADFIQWWSDEKNIPDVVTGWNIEYFDIPYLTRRMARILGDKYTYALSPWGSLKERNIFVEKTNRNHIVYDIGGVAQLDYLSLYKKFTYKSQESYALNYIAEVELGEKKLDHSEYETFKDFYTKNWTKFTAYNIKDVDLVDRLEDKMKLIELAITIAYSAKVNYSDVFYQVRVWDVMIYNYLKKKNIVVPPFTENDKDKKYSGAYVKEPIPGMYKWVLSFDLTSLYPSLIMQYNISPETLMEDKYPDVSIESVLGKKIQFQNLENTTVCANGSMYHTSKRGIFPEMVENIFKDRQYFKKKMLEEKSNLEKIENELSSRGVSFK